MHCHHTFNSQCRRHRRRVVHHCRCHCVAMLPSIAVIAAALPSRLPLSSLSDSIIIAFPSCLPLLSLLLRCCRTVHHCPSPSPLRCCHAVPSPLSPSSPLPSLSLLPPSPPPTFADPFVGWLLCCCVPVAPLRCRCRRCRRCCYHCHRHRHHPLVLIPLLVGCCVAVCAVDHHLLPGVVTLLFREFARPHCLRHRRPWAAQLNVLSCTPTLFWHDKEDFWSIGVKFVQLRDK